MKPALKEYPQPYEVWVKIDGVGYRCEFKTHSPSVAHDFARFKVAIGQDVELLEIRDTTGVIETLYRRRFYDLR